MDRRSFVGRSVAAILGATVAQTQPATGKEIHMQERWAHGGSFDELQMCHVRLDGEDVTRRCFYASEPKGEVGLYVKDEHGRSIVEVEKPTKWARLRGVFGKKLYRTLSNGRLVPVGGGWHAKTEYRKGTVVIYRPEPVYTGSHTGDY